MRGEVDLLPPPSPATNWTAALPTLPSSDSSLVFSFNGSTHVAVVPYSVASAVSGDHFTLQLWMRRGGASTQPPANQARGTRKEEETIICSTVKNGQSVLALSPNRNLSTNARKIQYKKYVFDQTLLFKKVTHIEKFGAGNIFWASSAYQSLFESFW